MFRKWIAIFKKDTLIDKAYRRSYQMLDRTREMFLKAKESLRQREDCEIESDIDNQDAEINRYEQEVRRNVFNHLVVGGTENLPSGLVLVSIIIDIERIGDYTKNIVELAMSHPGKLQGGVYEEDLQKIEEAVDDNFIKVRKYFEIGDIESSSQLLKDYEWIPGTCDRNLDALVKGNNKDISRSDAVALGVYFRWLKRIYAHLRNITTSIVNPFDRIGYNPKNK
jgi:Na+/phosphate symporter